MRNGDPPSPAVCFRCDLCVVHAHSGEPHIRRLEPEHGYVPLDRWVLELSHEHYPLDILSAVAVEMPFGEVGRTSSIDQIVQQNHVTACEYPVIGRQIGDQPGGPGLSARAVTTDDHGLDVRVEIWIVMLDGPHQLRGEGLSTVQQTDEKCVSALVLTSDGDCHFGDPRVDLGLCEEDLFVQGC